MKIPLIQPNPSRLSQLGAELALIEESGIYSNYGPVNTRFEQALTASLFSGVGGCLTVCNATIGLMVALRHAVDAAGRGLRKDEAARRRYVIMPSFTFAATAHAALWCGLTPLLCDIDPDTWLPSPEAEDALLARYAGQVAAIVPYATFGNCLDMDRYDRITREHGVPVVVDAAASLGSLDELGRGFGTGSRHSVVFSMHATKTFAVAEGGVIYNADPDALAAMRAMGNDGAMEGQAVSLPGLSAGLGEVAALQALAKLSEFPSVVAHRTKLAAAYARGLPGWTFQRTVGQLQTHQFMPVLLPDSWTGTRPAFLAALAERGVAAATYFSPHLAEQPYFHDSCVAGGLGTTERVASRVISLPLFDRLTEPEVAAVCAELRALVIQR